VIDCVVSYHLNPATCGVAKFNAVLAEQLGVPLLGLLDDRVLNYRRPLVSLKTSEFATDEIARLEQRLEALTERQSVRIFLHAYTDTPVEQRLVRAASMVFCGNPEVRDNVAHLRPDALDLWCPGTILTHDRFQPVDVSVLSFGMAHKVRSDHYVRLHRLLEATGKNYALYLSTALHENTSFDESFDGAFDEIRRVFKDNVHFLGFLSDAAVYNYMLDCTYFAAFFEHGVRSNNTSVNAAMSCGSVVITNLDDYSPASLEHEKNILDIDRLSALPTDPSALEKIGSHARFTANDTLGWSAFIARLSEAEVALNGHAEDTKTVRRLVVPNAAHADRS